ncbi:basic salivary proline-rich protein 2-like [Falco cherrug]|uniref:basic salivary proline-rich protein 2-like n=1 Tax=Falco cherrug TaxID=345164 RepID=UPI00247A10C5|nr:basic salivary proline-rich protein 2-like [Falco cherrug]
MRRGPGQAGRALSSPTFGVCCNQGASLCPPPTFLATGEPGKDACPHPWGCYWLQIGAVSYSSLLSPWHGVMVPVGFPSPCGFSGSEALRQAETRSSCLSDPQVKDEDKSLAVKRPGKEDGASESVKDTASAPPNPEPPSPEPPKSPEPPPGRGKSPEPVLNGAAVNGLEGPAAEGQGDDGQGLSRRRVVRVVRKVVRKVLPGEDAGSAKEPGRDTKSPEPVPPPRKEETGRSAMPAPPAAPPPPTVPIAPAKPEPKDEISAGLKTLMAKGKTKEHRPRLRPGDRQEKSPEPARGDAKPSLSPGTKAKPEPLVQSSGGKAEPAKASALKPTALERHKVPVCARRGML